MVARNVNAILTVVFDSVSISKIRSSVYPREGRQPVSFQRGYRCYGKNVVKGNS